MLFSIVLSFLLFASPKSDVEKYHLLINDAEEHIIHEAYNLATSKYQEAFAISTIKPFKKDFVNALIATIHNDDKASFKSILDGYTELFYQSHNRLTNFIDAYPDYQALLQNAVFKGETNIDYCKHNEVILFLDQSIRYNTPLIRYVSKEMALIDSINLHNINRLIEEQGLLHEWANCKAPNALNYVLKHNSDSNPSYVNNRNNLQDNITNYRALIENGSFHPQIYAANYSQLAQTQKFEEIYDANYIIINDRFYSFNISEEKKKIRDAARREIFLDPTDLFLEKLKFQRANPEYEFIYDDLRMNLELPPEDDAELTKGWNAYLIK